MAPNTPLVAYLAGLALIQSAVSLTAMSIANAATRRSDPVLVRLIGAGVVGIGVTVLLAQLVPPPPIWQISPLIPA